jgi:hypothetical protein
MTWTLILVFLITNNNVSTNSTPSIVMPGYKSLAICNSAAKEAIDNSQLALEAFCVTGP